MDNEAIPGVVIKNACPIPSPPLPSPPLTALGTVVRSDLTYGLIYDFHPSFFSPTPLVFPPPEEQTC